MHDTTNEKKETEILEIGIESIKIPECCTEGWKNCPHIVKPQKKTKKNIAL